MSETAPRNETLISQSIVLTFGRIGPDEDVKVSASKQPNNVLQNCKMGPLGNFKSWLQQKNA